MDLRDKPRLDKLFCFGKASGSGTQGEVSFLSWNSKNKDILASTSYNGVTVIWDIERQNPAISFSNSDRKCSSVLQWNPDLATQLIVVSDEDSSSSFKDLVTKHASFVAKYLSAHYNEFIDQYEVLLMPKNYVTRRQ